MHNIMMKIGRIFIKRFFFSASIYLCMSGPLLYADKIGLLIVATGQYIQWVEPLLESTDRYFCKNHTVTYFIFTDGNLARTDKVVLLPWKRLGWPHDTLLRCAAYVQYYNAWESCDYLFALDADMRFVGPVGDEILSNLVGTQHPGFVDQRGTYEYENPLSTACVNDNKGRPYCAGGFHGGSREEFYKLITTMLENINKDLENNYIALWHDESYLNRYFIDNCPTKILDPTYCYPESIAPLLAPARKKLIAYGYDTKRKLISINKKNHALYQTKL